ncbi:MAG: RagB/SusD family nutrient uptake outer membrane protein [Marinilabiliaceae bacterium]|nr:RagB/SusD family nutrient uptake outer membrane protein [Marinilabiliaceae bacterium]
MKYNRFSIFILCLVFLLQACNEDKWLEEVPEDFFSPENSYSKPSDIDGSLAYIYGKVRATFDGHSGRADIDLGTDLAMGGYSYETGAFGDYPANLTPTTGIVGTRWSEFYKMISNANAIIGRIDEIPYDDEDKKMSDKAEAYFFRAWAYRGLAHLYGGVPLQLEELTTPKRDFERNSRAEVYEQVKTDLLFAVEYLPAITEVEADGKLCKAAAYHLLSEIYLSLNDYDKAIEAASWVIDNPNYHLMDTRFGNKSNQPGDPYWDLFQMNNQNRNSGNTEGIWVMQVEFDIPGGGGDKWNHQSSYKFERYYTPLYWYMKDTEGKPAFIGPTTQNGGRGIGTVRGTTHFTHEIWEGDWNNDLRNNERNMMRDWVVDEPESVDYGKKISEILDQLVAINGIDTMRWYYAFPTKLTTIGDHPVEVLGPQPEKIEQGIMNSSSGNTFLDQYMMRLGETYLLRAEAYLGKGNKLKAAEDINAIRNRAQASPVSEADVTLDYLLDERMRELNFEEHRRITLARLGLVVERTQKYNPYGGKTIENHNNLYPIPFGEIEKNTEAELEQNPGYN